MNHKIKPLSIAFLLIASCFVSISEASAEPTSSPNRLVMCARKTWASTDKCKDPAVASKKAPKDLKKEIEKLASLTATSFEQLKIEQVALDNDYYKRLRQYDIDKAKVDLYNIVTQTACFKSFGKKYNPKVFDPNTPMKCLVLRDYGPESPSRIIGGASRIIWAQAWLDLATLAKTFPQHIQPSHLSLLINAYEPAKACVADYKCVPKGL